jgi:hypothetical protein
LHQAFVTTTMRCAIAHVALSNQHSFYSFFLNDLQQFGGSTTGVFAGCG